MSRRPAAGDASKIRRRIVEAVERADEAKEEDLREQVRLLVAVQNGLDDLGATVLGLAGRTSARDRILFYFRQHVGEVIDSDELRVVSGIQEYARRIRELRVQEGWPIIGGGDPDDDRLPEGIRLLPREYLLVEDAQDEEAARRWKLANEIRRVSYSPIVGQDLARFKLLFAPGDRVA